MVHKYDRATEGILKIARRYGDPRDKRHGLFLNSTGDIGPLVTFLQSATSSVQAVNFSEAQYRWWCVCE